MQKAKREDFKAEEDVRAQKAKYEESSEDVYRRMMDIKESEAESVSDLRGLLDAELAYYDSCRDILLKLKRDWPASEEQERPQYNRSRSNTQRSYTDRFDDDDRGLTTSKYNSRTGDSRTGTPRRDLSPAMELPHRPNFNRSNTDTSYASRGGADDGGALRRVPTEPTAMLAGRSQLRSAAIRNADLFDDPSDESAYGNGSSSPDRYMGERSDSPATTLSSRSTSWAANTGGQQSAGGRKAPPPPPPSRKKPAPPPPPMKRSALSTSDVPYA